MTSSHGRITGILFAVLLIAGAIFFGLQYLSDWHEEKIQSALELQREQFEEHRARLKREIARLEEQIAEIEQETALPDERDAEVFGESIPTEDETIDTCRFLEQRIASFFRYIGDKTDTGNKDAREFFFRMLEDLSEKTPVVVGETRDLITLLRNRAHFFRVINKERIDWIRQILKTDTDILESAMADFYAYYIDEQRCAARHDEKPMPMSALYDYAGFFLETISGKSYLMRRDSGTRILSVYYSILILDRAIGEGRNIYGIDIREHIRSAAEEIRLHRGLIHRDRYLETLDALERKYR